jgi:hypothetical protein
LRFKADVLVALLVCCASGSVTMPSHTRWVRFCLVVAAVMAGTLIPVKSNAAETTLAVVRNLGTADCRLNWWSSSFVLNTDKEYTYIASHGPLDPNTQMWCTFGIKVATRATMQLSLSVVGANLYDNNIITNDAAVGQAMGWPPIVPYPDKYGGRFANGGEYNFVPGTYYISFAPGQGGAFDITLKVKPMGCSPTLDVETTFDDHFMSIPASRVADQIQHLFTPASPADHITHDKYPNVRREALVRLNRTALHSQVIPLGAESAPDRVERGKRLGGQIVLNLFPNLAAPFRMEDIKSTENGYVWVGRGPGRYDTVTLVIDGDGMTGFVDLGKRRLRIEQEAGDLYRILEWGRFRGRRLRDAIPVNTLQGTGSSYSRTAVAGSSTITLLAAYTAAFERVSKGAKGAIRNIDGAISLANDSYRASAANITLKRVAMMKVDLKEGTLSGDLRKLSSNKVRGVHSKRDQSGADIVVLFEALAPTNPDCGLAYQPTSVTKDLAFAIVGDGVCLNERTLEHEIAHLMTVSHDRKAEDALDAPGYNFGYVNFDDKIMDIMSVPSSCKDKCVQVPVFSSGCNTYNGSKIGIPDPLPGAADASRTLNEQRASVAKFR